MRTIKIACLIILTALMISACKKKKTAEVVQLATPPPSPGVPVDQLSTKGQPDRIEVQHILISFQGRLPNKTVGRSQEEAKALAQKLFKEAKAGADFSKLVTSNTDDRPPGIYGIANKGVSTRGGEISRTQLFAALGDVGFKLKVGEIELADFDETLSPFGYEIIKRLK